MSFLAARSNSRPHVLLPAVLLALLAGRSAAQAVPADGGPSWAAVQQALGGHGTMQAGNVLKFGFPRGDLQVTVDGVTLKPALALGSWVAFAHVRGSSTSAMVMGDLVLTEDEVEPVMLSLQHHGIEQTALHNHLLHESPRIMYMHVMGHGDGAALAAAIRTALGESGTPVPTPGAGTPPPPAAPAAPFDLDTAAIARVLGTAGKVNGGVYQVSVPRPGAVTEHGMVIPPSMGVATAINFQPTGGGKAAITGDFVMTADEVNPVLRALRDHGIQVTALHSHMLTESPRLLFMHFWANDDAVTLAGDLRTALDRMKVRHPAE